MRIRTVLPVALIALSGCALFQSTPPLARERAGVVKMKGAPVTLIGPDLAVGKPAPEFRVVDGTYAPVSLSGFAGKPILISVVPSLDTAVCSLQTRRFNEEVRTLPAGTVALTISMDLPFAQKRFCESEKVGRILVLSDSAWRDFGPRYGVLVKERGLLARSVFVINRDGTLAYKEIVPEMSQEPDYDSALNAVRQAAAKPAPANR
jgi:thioredoxin-dependent peroxiredoxin